MAQAQAVIRLQFVQSPGLGSALIRWFDRGLPFSHVDAVLPDGRLLGTQRHKIGRFASGVQIRDQDYRRWTRKLVVELPASPEVAAKFYSLLRSDLGKPFDNSGQWAFLFGRDWREDDSWFCSEQMASRLELAGYWEFPLVLAANRVTPGDLLLLASSRVRVRLDQVKVMG